MTPSPYLPAIVLLGSSILWGVVWWPLKWLLGQGLSSAQILFVAYAFLFLITLPWLWRERQSVAQHYKALALIAVGGGLANFCFNYAIMHGQVLRVMALFYLLPVWGVLGGHFILRERITWWRWLGVALALIGAGIVLQVHTLWQSGLNWIDLLSVLSSLFFAATILVFRGVQGVPIIVKINPLFFGVTLISGVLLMLSSPTQTLNLNGHQVLWVLVFALGYLLWASLGTNWSATQLPAGRSSIIMVMELVAAVVSATLIAKEPINLNLLLGGILILNATAIEILQTLREEKTKRAF